MKKAIPFLLGMVILMVLFCSSGVEAYGGKTHRYLARRAAYLLANEYSQYIGITGRQSLKALMKGAEEEDDRHPIGLGYATRSKNHFLRPVDGSGWYSVSEIGSRGLYADAYSWAVGMPDYNWSMALGLYVNGSRLKAFEYLGHIAHLIQDLTVPAHTHIDTHPPPMGDDYESYCETKTSDYRTSIEFDWNKVKIPSTQTGLPHIFELKRLFYDAAWKSYNLNRFKVETPKNFAGSWDGELADMYRIKYDDVTFGWHIKGIGFLGRDWWECELDPGYYYIENTGLDTQIPLVWQNQLGTKHLCEYFAQEMIPAALGYTAAIYKLFFETIEDLKKEREQGLYVSINGNDEFGTGVKSMPYKTLRHALVKSWDGAVIHVAPGTYINDGRLEMFDRHIIGDKDNKPIFTCNKEGENIFHLGWEGTSVENIRFTQKSDQKLTGIYISSGNRSSKRVIIRNCEFTGLQTAINTFRSSVAIDSNVFRNCV